MKITFLSANNYADPAKNNGACILVDNGTVDVRNMPNVQNNI